MARKKRSRTTTSNENGTPARLPASQPEFAELVKRTRGESRRDELRSRIIAEFDAYEQVRDSATQADSLRRSPAGKVFERRLLAFVDPPRISREFGWDLEVAIEESWMDLADLRSPAFASMLRTCVASGEKRLSTRALRALASMGRDADLPILVAKASDGSWKELEEVAEGITSAVERGAGSQRFRSRMTRAFATAVGKGAAPTSSEAAHHARFSVVRAIIAMGQREASHVLFRPPVMSADNAAIYSVLSAIGSEQFPHLDATSIKACLQVVDAIMQRGAKPIVPSGRNGAVERTRILCDLLLQIARSDTRGAREACETIARQAAKHKEIAVALERIRGTLSGAPDLEELYRLTYEAPSRIPKPVRPLAYAHALLVRVSGDGLEAYCDEDKERMGMAIVGLGQAGFERLAAMLERVAQEQQALSKGTPRGAGGTIVRRSRSLTKAENEIFSTMEQLELGIARAIASMNGDRTGPRQLKKR